MDSKSGSKAVHVDPVLVETVRHPIKAARLLYTPPGYIIRGPIHVVSIVVLVALLYSFWGTKDELVETAFRLDREGSISLAVGGGLVSQVYIKEGDMVTAGAPLVDIQERTRATSSPELEFLNQQKSQAEARLIQLRLDLEDNINSSETQTVIFTSKIEQIEEQLSSANRALARRKNQLQLAQKQFERKKTLFSSRDITLPEFEDAQQRLNETEKSVDDMNSEILTIKVSLNTAKVELSRYGNIKTRQRIEKSIAIAEDEIAEIATKIRGSQNLVEGVTYDNSIAQYRSKATGQVTRLLVAEEQLVSTGAPLVVVIPEGAPLEARGVINNAAIGKLRRLQDVKLKYFAFPFQEYGIAAGKIKSISTIPSELKGEEGSYAITVALDQEYVSKRDGKRVPLSMGLAGFAEIKVGEKKLIEILFSPVSKFLDAKEF